MYLDIFKEKKSACATLLLMASPVAAVAEICTFTQECYETEGCAETSFQIEIAGDTLITDFATIPVNSGGDKTGAFVGHQGGAMHLLTRTQGGAARYTTHIFDGIQMVSYAGTCE